MEHPNEFPYSPPKWKTRPKKMVPRSVLTQEATTMTTWTLVMQECGLYISLQQLKMKVVKLTQTRARPF
jgi:hypothetical protein